MMTMIKIIKIVLLEMMVRYGSGDVLIMRSYVYIEVKKLDGGVGLVRSGTRVAERDIVRFVA